jgi:hypothetical protein
MAPAAPSSNTPPQRGGAGGAQAELTSEDPSINTHLGLDLNEIPSSLNVALEMDGKVFWRRGSPGSQPSGSPGSQPSGSPGSQSNGSPGSQPSQTRLLVPPGKHEFRVIVSRNGESKSSNLVKAASDPSVHLTLAVSIRPRPVGNAMALDPAARVIAVMRPSGPRDATGGQPGERMNPGQQQAPARQNSTRQ